MGSHRSTAIFISVAILAGAVSAAGQTTTVTGRRGSVSLYKPGSFKSISRAEIELLLADVAESNPQALKRLAEDPEQKKSQINNLRELLALASEAERTGLAAEPTNRQELENIRAEVSAVNYDRHVHKSSKSVAPYSSIGDDLIAQFWANDTAVREVGFKAFLDAKLELLKSGDPSMKDRAITDEEKQQARDLYAKTKIYENEYKDRLSAGVLPKTLREKIDLQVKLQQAQFLARRYSDVMASSTTVSDAEVAKYISAHPELDSAPKKARAEKILQRARAGEDFARLANEFSEDPGNKTAGGPQGGLYRDVSKGMMIEAFEKAALGSKAGEVVDRLVETDFGYHIIKLEKSLGVPPAPETYDVRHILIGTTIENSADPTARPVPVAAYVRSKLSSEKETRLLEEIVARNNVSVPDDFTVPGFEAGKPVAVKRVVPARKKRPVARGSRRAIKRKP